MREEAAAEYLERPLRLKCRIQKVIAKKEELEQSALHGIDYSSGGSRGADATSRTERTALKAVKLEEEYERLYTDWCNAQLDNLDVVMKVQQLDARAALVLTYTYISGLSAAETADRMRLSDRQVFRLRKEALQLACKVMSDPETKEALP